MKNILKVGLCICLSVGLGGCFNKESNIEKYNGLGKKFANEIYSKQKVVKEKDLLGVCLSKVDESDIKNNGSEAITFVTNECINELRNMQLINLN